MYKLKRGQDLTDEDNGAVLLSVRSFHYRVECEYLNLPYANSSKFSTPSHSCSSSTNTNTNTKPITTAHQSQINQHHVYNRQDFIVFIYFNLINFASLLYVCESVSL